MPRRSPGAKAKRLAKELAACREAAGLSLREAAQDMGWDKSKLSRLESGQRNFTLEEVSNLLGIYKVTGERRDRLQAMARTIDEPGWWERGLKGLPVESATLADYESEAERITNWAPLVIPGLLQTMEYARAWMVLDELGEEDIELRLMARARRQRRVLDGDVQYVAYIGEAALRTPIGGHANLSRQLSRLLELSQRDNVTVRVVPLDAPPHRGLLQAFLVIETNFEPVVHSELIRSGVFMDDDELTGPYMATLTHLGSVALSETESRSTISKVQNEVDDRWKT